MSLHDLAAAYVAAWREVEICHVSQSDFDEKMSALEKARSELFGFVDGYGFERSRKPKAWIRRYAYEGNNGTKGNRPPGWQLHEVTIAKLRDDDLPLFLGEAE